MKWPKIGAVSRTKGIKFILAHDRPMEKYIVFWLGFLKKIFLFDVVFSITAHDKYVLIACIFFTKRGDDEEVVFFCVFNTFFVRLVQIFARPSSLYPIEASLDRVTLRATLTV